MQRKDRPAMKQAQRFGAVLKQVLGDRGMNDRLSRYQAWLIWDQLVGEQIARRARPLRFRQGVLEVQVDHPVWMKQLQMLKPQILAKLTQQLPNAGITDIFLRNVTANFTSTLPAAKESTTPRPAKIQLSAAEEREGESKFAAVSDPELRQEFKRLWIRQRQLDKARTEPAD